VWAQNPKRFNRDQVGAPHSAGKQSKFNRLGAPMHSAMRSTSFLMMSLAVVLCACAGRAPQPVAVVQPQDRYADCAAVTAEVESNNEKVRELASEQGLVRTSRPA
jgi:hypothetical protein